MPPAADETIVVESAATMDAETAAETEEPAAKRARRAKSIARTLRIKADYEASEAATAADDARFREQMLNTAW